MKIFTFLLLLVSISCSQKQIEPEVALKEFISLSEFKDLRIDSFKLLNKTCSNEKCSLTYSVGYSTKQGQKIVSNSEVKKTAEMVRMKDKWLIAGVTNLETSHESLDPINL